MRRIEPDNKDKISQASHRRANLNSRAVNRRVSSPMASSLAIRRRAAKDKRGRAKVRRGREKDRRAERAKAIRLSQASRNLVKASSRESNNKVKNQVKLRAGSRVKAAKPGAKVASDSLASSNR